MATTPTLIRDYQHGLGIATGTNISRRATNTPTGQIYTTDTVTIVEVMGRNAGWIAAATGVAHRCEQDAPHLIYLPEIPFSIDKFVGDVREVVKRLGGCVITAGEGIRDADGNYRSEAVGAFGKDSFGHAQLGGAADVLRAIVEKEVGVKARTNKLGTHQRSAMHFAVVAPM